MTGARVVVVGSCVMDYITTTPRFPRAGETVFGHGLRVGCGGKGANQCLAAARLGAHTAIVAKLGTDVVGDQFLATLREAPRINTDHVTRTSEAQTAVAAVTVQDGGENCIVNIPGANHLLTTADVAAAAALMAEAKVLVCQNELKMETTKAALIMARQSGVTTLFNAGPAVPDLDPEIISNTDILCVNETEAEVLTGVAVSSRAEAVQAGRVMLSKGCGAALLTLGAQGIVWVDNGKEGENEVFVEAEKVEAVDTTGAGDAFIGALAFFLAYHADLPLKEKLRRACVVATASVKKSGAWDSFPCRTNLPEDLFRN